MSDIYTSDEFQKKANKSALILARTRYNELIAPFVKNSSERFEFAANDIEKIVVGAAFEFDADEEYVRSNLREVIAEEIKTAESEDKRTLEKGLGVGKERVKEDLTNAGDAYNPFDGDSSSDKDTSDKGLGVSGQKGEEAVSEIKEISLEFSENDAENKEVGDDIAGGPETPESEVKPVDEKPDDVAEESDISYGGGSVLEDEIRGPSGGGKGAVHDLKEDTFKWTKVEDRLVIETATKEACCGSDCGGCDCGGSCGSDCPCKKKV